MTATETQQTSLSDYVRSAAQAYSGKELRARFGPSALKRAVARGELVRVHPDVYAPSGHENAFDVRAKAASLWAGAPVAGLAALFIWGLFEEPPQSIEVVLAQDEKPRRRDGVRVRRLKVPVPHTIRNGIPVVTPAAAVVLGYGCLPKKDRSSVFYAALGRRLAGVRQFEALLDALPKVKGRRSLERSVRAAASGARSYLEERALYKVFNTQEFSRFVRQHEVVIEGNQYFLDMFDPVTRTALELDGRLGHINEYRQRNIERDCWVATLGIQTLRFSYQDLMERPEWCRQVVREVLAVRTEQQRTARQRT